MDTWLKGLGAWLGMVGTLLAAPLFDEAVPRLTLKDGTVLQDAQIKGYLNNVVMVKHRGGARTVPYGVFPDEYQAVLAARRPAPHEAPATAPAHPAAGGRAETRPAGRSPDLRYGCSFSVLTVTGDIVAMEIHNESRQLTAVYPQMFMAQASSGEMLPGMQWVGLNSEGRVTVMLKRQQLIAPGDAVTLHLMVAQKPHEGAIGTVQWKN